MRQTEILVEQQPPPGVFVCDYAGLVINKFSNRGESELAAASGEEGCVLQGLLELKDTHRS